MGEVFTKLPVDVILFSMRSDSGDILRVWVIYIAEKAG
jgi:hypothetical protein